MTDNKTCGARFFRDGGPSKDNACQLPRGHAGSHITGESEPQTASDGMKYISTIRWNDAPSPLMPSAWTLSMERDG